MFDEIFIKEMSSIDAYNYGRQMMEKEINELGECEYNKGRADAIDECKKIVMAECTTTCEYPFFPNCVECMTNKMEKLKEQK